MDLNLIAINLKGARISKSLSQFALSAESGVDQGDISRIESGVNKNPKISTLKLLSESLGIKVSQLIGEMAI